MTLYQRFKFWLAMRAYKRACRSYERQMKKVIKNAVKNYRKGENYER